MPQPRAPSVHMPRPATLLARRRSSLAVAVGVALLGLGGCELVTGPGRLRSDLRGEFDGRFTLEWEPVDIGRSGLIDGPGSIRIRRHRRSTFSGDWAWRPDGHLLRGDLESGREALRDEVSFFLEFGFGRDLMEEVTGCFFVAGERRFHGFVTHRRLRADRTARLRCHDSFGGFGRDVVFHLSFSGRR